MSTLTTSHQPFWESSRRPLHPKCIGSNGHRHFIFDYNLTHADRSRSETLSLNEKFTTKFPLEKMRSLDTIENRMNSLSIIGSGEGKSQNDRAFSSLGDHSEIMEFFIENESIEPLDLYENETNDEIIKIQRETSPPSTKMNGITHEIDSSKNLLAERVLQWLDLAGGRNSKTEKLLAPKRRSVTAKELRKLPECEEDSNQQMKFKRETVRQLSMTFNDEQAKDTQNINQNIVSLSFGDLFPVTYKCSRKFLTIRRTKNVADRLEPLDLQSSIPLKMANTKKDHKEHSNGIDGGGKMKQKRLEYFEQQYRSLIQRQILETTCNTQAAKRQLHIFLPNLPNRCLAGNESKPITQLASPNSARDADSCLSCCNAAST